MKTALVTSKVTFIDNNYQFFIENLLGQGSITHLVVLDNSSAQHLLKAIGLMVAGATNTGKNLFLNELFKNKFNSIRKNLATANQVKFHNFKSVNSDEFHSFVKKNSIDLIINSRTRSIYKKKTLNSPTIGCINIHHGLLPEQRGTLCDLQSLYKNQKAGFTIHEMTSKLDDGRILSKVIVTNENKFTSFSEYQQKSMEEEARACTEVIKKIARLGSLYGDENTSDNITYYKTPTLKEIRRIKKDIIL